MTKGDHLDSIVREYLELAGFELTVACFDNELEKLGKKETASNALFPNVSERVQQRKKELLDLFDKGRRREFCEMWEESLSVYSWDDDASFQHLQFYLQLYFAIYPLRGEHTKAEVVDDHMSQYKLFLETRGAHLSQTTEFLPYYALPFIPMPKDHPSFKEIFQDSWVVSIREKLDEFLETGLKRGMRSRLSELVSWETTAQHQLQQAFNRIAEMTHKLATHQQRFRKIQEDYHKLMGLASELIGSLEMAVRGELTDIDPIMNLCARSFPEIFGRGSANGDNHALESSSSLSSEVDLQPLNFDKIRRDFSSSQPHSKALLLQALRWRLTQVSHGSDRAEVLATYISADLLGCVHPGVHRKTVLSLITSPIEEVRQSCARLLNGFASFREGRMYLAQCSELVGTLLDNLIRRKVDGITLDMTLATLQKLSLRRNHQNSMIDGGMVEWLLGMLEDHDSFSVYSLEYAVALFMNLCLRSVGKLRCVNNPRRVLVVLTDLLGSQNQEIIPYVNGALYSVLSVPAVRREAQAMAMEDILRCFIQEGNSEMRRQLEFILKQLTSDNADEQHSDDEDRDDEDDDDDDEESQDLLEEDLDRDDCVLRTADDVVGEELLTSQYLLFPVNGVPKPKRRMNSSRTEVLTRPSTPRVNRNIGSFHSAPIKTGDAPHLIDQSTRTLSSNGALGSSSNNTMQNSDSKPPRAQNCGSRKSTASTKPEPIETDNLNSLPDAECHPDSQDVDVEASEIVGKITGVRKVLAGAVSSPVPPKAATMTVDEYIVAFSTRPKIPRTPEGGRSSNGDRAGPSPTTLHRSRSRSSVIISHAGESR